MEKIKKIVIQEIDKSIPANFLLEVEDFTVITGENNSGKTNFIKAIDAKNVKFEDKNGKDITKFIEIIYIPAEYIIGDDQFKIGKTTNITKTLKGIIQGSPYFEFKKDGKNHADNFEDLVKSVNEKIADMLGDGKKGKESIKISLNKQINLQDILELVLKFIPLDYSTGNTHLKFDELGQGWQRLIIAIFQLVVSEKTLNKEKIRLILFEEPEAYLHSKLKKVLNELLQEIAIAPNSQVIITTHDPYFAFSNSGDSNNKVYTFERDGKGITQKKPDEISGIQDELLHIFLFDRALKVKNMDLANFGKYLLKQKKILTKQYFWHKFPKGEKVALPIYIRHQIHHRSENKYNGNKNPIFTDKELEESIKILNRESI